MQVIRGRCGDDILVIYLASGAAECSDETLEWLCQACVLLDVCLRQAFGAVPFTPLNAVTGACARVWVGSAYVADAAMAVEFH